MFKTKVKPWGAVYIYNKMFGGVLSKRTVSGTDSHMKQCEVLVGIRYCTPIKLKDTWHWNSQGSNGVNPVETWSSVMNQLLERN